MQLSGGKNSGPLLITAVVLALLFAVYYYVVLPKQREAEEKQSAVNHLKSEISTMREQIVLIKEEDNGTMDSEFIIRKKLPASREIDQLLLSFEEAEYISGSRILGISFNNYGSLVSASGLAQPEEEALVDEANDADAIDEATEGDAVSEEGAESMALQEDMPVSTMTPESLPDNLKMITFEVEVESPDYDQLQQFIREIEGLERVMHIDAIEYALPGEEASLEEEASSSVSANIQVTTFYFE